MTAVETVWVTAPDKAAAPTGGEENIQVVSETIEEASVEIWLVRSVDFQGAVHQLKYNLISHKKYRQQQIIPVTREL